MLLKGTVSMEVGGNRGVSTSHFPYHVFPVSCPLCFSISHNLNFGSAASHSLQSLLPPSVDFLPPSPPGSCPLPTPTNHLSPLQRLLQWRNGKKTRMTGFSFLSLGFALFIMIIKEASAGERALAVHVRIGLQEKSFISNLRPVYKSKK